MKIIKTILSLSFTGLILYFLHNGVGPLPALGKFLNPFTGFWTNSEINSIEKEGSTLLTNLKIPGCTDEVTIKYDENGVPHIFANNNHDLYFAQGWVTAKDRLWQMEFLARAAGGAYRD